MTLSLWLAASACAAQTFSFAVLADTHVGRRVPDFGTPGYDDELRGLPRANERLRRVRVALDKVRALREKQDIRFVVVVGDLTEHGERSEFLAARALFDALPIPYVPVLGNHDFWPGTSREEAPEPIGDR
ncbi:MAG: metallophosphoesterase [Elusimicrobia bacterium]|nr:metallophosphoesterase [Elusimicrobiota bacterium]